MTFTVISNSFKDGDYLPSDFILSANLGFGCAGGAPKIKVDCARRLARRGALTPNYRAESYGPFKLPIENQLCQRSRCFLSLHFLFKDLTQYQERYWPDGDPSCQPLCVSRLQGRS